MAVITFDASATGLEVLMLGKWLEGMNLNAKTIRKVMVDTDRQIATIYNDHGGSADFPLVTIPAFITYRLKGLAPCGHHKEDSYGVRDCLACKAKRSPLELNRGDS